MEKAQGIQTFWGGFGLPAYDEHTVPPDAEMPYITYSVSADSIGTAVPLGASLWYHSTSWEEIEAKAAEIAEQVYRMPKPIIIDGGYLWIVRGSPFSQRLSDPVDDGIRRIYINCTAEFLTAY